MARAHYTLVCRHQKCQKIIMLTRNPRVPRPVRYGECAMCKTTRWDYRHAPLKESL